MWVLSQIQNFLKIPVVDAAIPTVRTSKFRGHRHISFLDKKKKGIYFVIVIIGHNSKFTRAISKVSVAAPVVDTVILKH